MKCQIYETTYDNSHKVGKVCAIKRLNKCNKVYPKVLIQNDWETIPACALKNVEKLLNKANIGYALELNK
jgi:hypothetical protein